jgi:hypothetical protein
LANGNGAPSRKNLRKRAIAPGFCDRRHPLFGPLETARVDARWWIGLDRAEAAVSIAVSNRISACRALVASALKPGRSPKEYASISRRPTDAPRRKQRNQQVDEGVRGSSRQSCSPADKAATVAPHGCTKAQARLLSDPKPVVRRQTRDRWRLDDRKVVRRLHERSAETPRSQDPRSGRRRVSHGNRRGLQKCCSCECS